MQKRRKTGNLTRNSKTAVFALLIFAAALTAYGVASAAVSHTGTEIITPVADSERLGGMSSVSWQNIIDQKVWNAEVNTITLYYWGETQSRSKLTWLGPPITMGDLVAEINSGEGDAILGIIWYYDPVSETWKRGVTSDLGTFIINPGNTVAITLAGNSGDYKRVELPAISNSDSWMTDAAFSNVYASEGIETSGLITLGKVYSGAFPACTAQLRGGMVLEKGAAGEEDKLQVCKKDSSGIYNWIESAPPATPPSEPPLGVTCVASPSPAVTGETVLWEAQVSGGTLPYSFSWAGDVVGINNPASKVYSSTGTKTATVTVQSASLATAQATCQVYVGSFMWVRYGSCDDDTWSYPTGSTSICNRNNYMKIGYLSSGTYCGGSTVSASTGLCTNTASGTASGWLASYLCSII